MSQPTCKTVHQEIEQSLYFWGHLLDTTKWFASRIIFYSLLCILTFKAFESSLIHILKKNFSFCLIFLAATKQLYKWSFPSVCPSVRLSVCPSVRLSVRLSHLFDYVLLNVSSWNFQELLLMTKVRSMQKVKVRGQRSRSQRSQPNLTVSGL